MRFECAVCGRVEDPVVDPSTWSVDLNNGTLVCGDCVSEGALS